MNTQELHHLLNAPLDEFRAWMQNYENFKFPNGESILHLLVRHPIDRAKFRVLQDLGANLNEKDNRGNPLIFTAIDYYNIDNAIFLGNVMNVDLTHVNEKTGLQLAHYCALDLNLCQAFVEKVDLKDAVDIHGNVPLHYAVFFCNFQTAEYIIGLGVSINVTDKYEMTGLMKSVLCKKPTMFKKLIALGANVHMKLPQNTLVTHLAAEYGQLEILKYLIEELNFDPFAMTEFDNSLLHKAAESGDLEVIQYCLDLGLDEHAVTSKNTNMVQKASFKKLEALKFFLDRGHDPYHVNMEGDNAIVIAAERGKLKIIRYLYENYRLSLFAADRERTTAYELARKNKYAKVTEYLEEISAENWENRKALLSLRYSMKAKSYN